MHFGDSVTVLLTPRESTCSLTPSNQVTVLPDSLIKLQANAVELEHGGITVARSKNLAAHIGDVTVQPANGDWTEFQVADVDGSVKIIARTSDLAVTDQEGTTTVPAGQETTRDETSQRKKREGNGAVVAAQGGILDSSPAMIAGTAIVGGVTAWVLLQGDDPESPDKP